MIEPRSLGPLANTNIRKFLTSLLWVEIVERFRIVFIEIIRKCILSEITQIEWISKWKLKIKFEKYDEKK